MSYLSQHYRTQTHLRNAERSSQEKPNTSKAALTTAPSEEGADEVHEPVKDLFQAFDEAEKEISDYDSDAEENAAEGVDAGWQKQPPIGAEDKEPGGGGGQEAIVDNNGLATVMVGEMQELQAMSSIVETPTAFVITMPSDLEEGTTELPQ